MLTNQMLAVWGSPNSGKTSISIKLAKTVSQKRKNVVLVLCDNLCPCLPVILPMSDIRGKSLGSLLANGDITQDKILINCVTLRRNEFVSVLGYKKGENIFSHAAYTKEKAVDLLVLLRHLAEYVIIDCSSNLSSDVLSTIALETADAVLRLGKCDLKGASYFSSQLPLLGDRKFNADHHIKILSDIGPYEPKNEIREYYKGVRYEIQHVDELMEQFLKGKLFEKMDSKEGKAFEKTIRSIVEEVLKI